MTQIQKACLTLQIFNCFTSLERGRTTLLPLSTANFEKQWPANTRSLVQDQNLNILQSKLQRPKFLSHRFANLCLQTRSSTHICRSETIVVSHTLKLLTWVKRERPNGMRWRSIQPGARGDLSADCTFISNDTHYWFSIKGFHVDIQCPPNYLTSSGNN